MKNTLIVVSLLDGKGPTGVEAHFTQVLDEARAAGIDAVLAAAYPARRWWAALARKLLPALRLVHAEYAEIVSLRINQAVLGGKLATLLTRRTGAVTLYAQDPVSAGAALRARQRHPCRVVTVVHYNASQADELLAKGDAAAGGVLCRFLAAAEAASLPQVDQLIFVSRFMQEKIARRMPKIGAVPQAVVPNFAARPAAINPEALPVRDLIAIGTLEPRKNQAFLLQVLANAKTRGFPFTLTIVGNGPDHGMLVALTTTLGLDEQVTFAGLQAQAGRLIAQHRALAHAALIENMPITLIEALSMGRPILAPAVGGIPEVFADGVEGYFWPLDDIDAATTLLIRLLTDDSTYRRMIRAAGARYTQTFQRERLLARWLKILFPLPQGATECVQ